MSSIFGALYVCARKLLSRKPTTPNLSPTQLPDRDKELVRVRALTDQVWAELSEELPDIERIARDGPNGSDDDTLIVRTVFCAALGRLELGE